MKKEQDYFKEAYLEMGVGKHQYKIRQMGGGDGARKKRKKRRERESKKRR